MTKLVVTEGNAEQVVKRFGGKGIIEEQEGFIDCTVMVKKVRRILQAIKLNKAW